jgi:penicillin amidase
MRRYQADPGSARADYFAPFFLRAGARYAAPNAPAAGVDPRTLAHAARLLGQWDRRYDTANTRAVLFEWALSLATNAAWDELRRGGDRPAAAGDPFGKPTRRAALAAVPSSGVLAELFADSASAWWDVRATPGRVERRDEVLAAALAAALDTCRAKYGAPDAGGWRWARLRHANVRHLARLPAFSRLALPVPGGPNTLWPSTGGGGAGPSWRMVVELGPAVRAWGVYPGGQSGDPLSPGYDDRLAHWLDGTLDSLRVPRTPADLGRDLRQTLTLRPPRP